MTNQPLRLAVSARVMRDRGRRMDVLAHDWIPTLESWNAVPYLVPNTFGNIEQLLQSWNVEALLLPGGGPPAHPADPAPSGGSAKRDAAEAAMLDYAIRRRMPVVGVGRGAQVINVHFGGTLSHGRSRHRRCVHPLRPVPAEDGRTPFRACLVNSHHKLVIRPADLAAPLKAFGIGPDDGIEAFHHEDLPMVGVMWHPERAGPPSEQLDRLLSGALRGVLPWVPSATSSSS